MAAAQEKAVNRAEMASLRRISAARSSDVFAQRRKGLSVIDRVAHELLVHPDMAGIMTTKQMRILLRYKAGVKELNGLSNHILQAVNMLLKVCIPKDIGPSRWTRVKLGFKDTSGLNIALKEYIYRTGPRSSIGSSKPSASPW